MPTYQDNPSNPQPYPLLPQNGQRPFPQKPDPFGYSEGSYNPFAPPPSTTFRQKISKHNYAPSELLDFKDSQGIKGGGYPLVHIKGVIQAAKAMGEDPYDALALAMQETGLGKDGNPRSLIGTSYEMSDKGRQTASEMSQKYPDLNGQYFQLVQALKEKKAYARSLKFVNPNDPAQVLQAYNGYGKLTRDNVKSNKAYGIPIPESGLDMKANPLYGKRLMSLKKDMMNNSAWKNLVDSIK